MMAPTRVEFTISAHGRSVNFNYLMDAYQLEVHAMDCFSSLVKAVAMSLELDADVDPEERTIMLASLDDKQKLVDEIKRAAYKRQKTCQGTQCMRLLSIEEHPPISSDQLPALPKHAHGSISNALLQDNGCEQSNEQQQGLVNDSSNDHSQQVQHQAKEMKSLLSYLRAKLRSVRVFPLQTPDSASSARDPHPASSARESIRFDNILASVSNVPNHGQ
jgi:hypothetical protein